MQLRGIDFASERPKLATMQHRFARVQISLQLCGTDFARVQPKLATVRHRFAREWSKLATDL